MENFTISYKKIKDGILMNPKGIIMENGYSIASIERAFLDTLYLYGDYYFDNLSLIDWKKAEDLIGIYENKALEKRFGRYVER